MNTPDSKTGGFGIQVTLPENDPFRRLLDEGWNTQHWFQSRYERDRALKEMSREHEYSRKGDAPTLLFEVINNTSDS
ncbi:MAG: hypothetical protein CL799_02190 [Chromatiales bacterium]|jgi:hypothetical protein|nr:hypothetical protein [Chromatiales bacterium]MDP6151510.1 hypothetical protein [Gammaproteobacteria bacterium]MDP7093086.1 hypothetical protein [Gammaproteobacteria bacterium]MDP7271497.1 hypothetical protein [Gammaproteobacteria bacterium]HJP04543.1 hypothetical protein [Gammaproteobacteria bacterium]